MIQKKEIYNKVSKYLIRASFLLLIVIICSTLFFLAKRTKGVKLAMGFLENIRSARIDSSFFGALKEAYVMNENIGGLKDKVVPGDKEFFCVKVAPRRPVFIDPDNLLPLEMHFYKGPEEILCRDKGLGPEENISWYFSLDKKKKLFYIDARNMYLPEDPWSKYTRKLEGGMFIAGNSSIYYVLEFSSGLKEFKVNAAGKRGVAEYDQDFDYSPRLAVSLDGGVIGEAVAKEGEMRTFIFNAFIPGGWHKAEIAFTNDIWQPEKGWDRNLLVKDLEISDILGTVYLRIDKGLGEGFLNKNYSLSYLRALNDADKNELIGFFKKKFKVESLRDIVTQDFPVKDLIREVGVNNLIKRSIFAPAPSKIMFKAKVPVDGIKLVFSFAVMEEAWGKPGDGVEFLVKAKASEAEPEDLLFSKYINPKVNEADRKWFQGEAVLRKYKGKEIILIFETRGSPVSAIRPNEDYAYDWAAWSD